MTSELLIGAYLLVLSVFVGFEVISNVPTLLHTPLMSGTNAIHGVVLVGALLILGSPAGGLATVLGFVAVVLAAANVFGGFALTDRMLQTFRKKGQD